MTDTAAVSRAPVGPDAGALPEMIAELARPLATEAGCVLYDVAWRGGTLVVLASGTGGNPVDVEALSRLSRKLSAALDAEDPIESRYVLEVSSPGLERMLVHPEHFAGALGERVVIRTEPGERPRQRVVGAVLAADARGVTVRVDEVTSGEAGGSGRSEAGEQLVVPFSEIAKARTTFDWGPAPRHNRSAGAPGRGDAGRAPKERQGR